MRILYLTGEAAHGADLQPHHPVHALARMAQREGHQVEVVTASAVRFSKHRSSNGLVTQDHKRLVKGVQVMDLAPLTAEVASARFANWLSEQQFDILHGVFTHPEDWPFELDAELLPPLVVTLTGLPADISSAPVPTVRSWMVDADLRVVPSTYAAEQWQDVWPGSSFRVLPHGVDLLALIQARETQMRGITAQSPPTLLCVGTFDQYSGVLELVKAFSALGQPDLRLHLIGGIDGHSAYGQSLIDSIRSDTRIHQTPAQRPVSIAEIAQPFDALCLPGLESGSFSMIAQECAALGVPCFINYVGEEPDAIPLDDCVQHSAPADASAWAMSIDQWVFTFDRAQRSSMGQAVPLRIEEEAFFYEGLYRSLIFKYSP